MLLKELRHNVKQKNPDTEKDIKIPARNKGRDSPPHTRLAKRLANSQNSTQQLGGLGGDVGLAHEGGADEDGLGAARLQSLDVGSGVDAALGQAPAIPKALPNRHPTPVASEEQSWLSSTN